jgi:hypothetical protein
MVLTLRRIKMDEQAKLKHSKRLQQKENHVRKEMKIAKAHGIPVENPHELLKKSPVSCGNPKCVMCGNPRKMWHELTIQEKRAHQEMETQRARHGNGTLVDEIDEYLKIRNG